MIASTAPRTPPLGQVVEHGPRQARDVRRALADGPVVMLPEGGCWPEAPRHVGVAYDGTPAASAALTAAFDLAAAHGSAMTLYWVLSPFSVVDEVVDEDDALRERDRAYELLDAAAARAPAGVNPQRRVLSGAPVRTVAEAADQVVDVLIIGGRTRAGWRKHLGGFSTRMLERATFPVVVVPLEAC